MLATHGAVDIVESALVWAKHSDCARFGIAPTTEGWTREWIRRQLERMDLAPSVLLDLGCGHHSALTCWYSGRVRHAFLVDLHHPPARFPRSTSLKHDLELPLPIPGESVDIVISASAFQFLTPAGRRLQMAEIQRVLRPGGVALLTMVWLSPLTPTALLTLANEPFMQQRHIRLFAAPDVADMLGNGANLRVDGEFVRSEIPGFEGFSIESISANPELLVSGLTEFDPSAFQPETVALGIQRFALGMRLKKQQAEKSVENSGLKIFPDLVETLNRNPETISADSKLIIARNCLSGQRDPQNILKALAETGANFWIDDTFVDSGEYECVHIPADDIVEHPSLPGKMRMSLSWLFRELIRLNFDPVLIDPSELPAGNGQIVRSPRRMLVSATRCRNAGDDPPLLVHVHLPKNAGSSFNDLLRNSFGPQFVPMYLKDPKQRFDEFSMVQALRERPVARAVASHSFGVFPPRVAGYRPLYVAFLREPLARQYSYYRYGLKCFNELSRQHRDVLPADFQLMSLGDFLRFEISLAENRVLNSSQAFALTESEDSTAAIAALSGFFFVGIVEQMELSMRLLRAKLQQAGLPLALDDLKRVNATTSGHDEEPYPDSSESRELLGHLQADLQIYEWGCRRLEAEARSLRGSLSASQG